MSEQNVAALNALIREWSKLPISLNPDGSLAVYLAAKGVLAPGGDA